MENSSSTKIKQFIAVIFLYSVFPFIGSIISDSKIVYYISSTVGIVFMILLFGYMKNNKMISFPQPIIKSPAIALLFPIFAFNYKCLIAAITSIFVSEPLYTSSSGTNVSLLFMCYIIIIAPIAEELIYRYALPNIFINNKDKVSTKIAVAIIGTLIWNFRHGDNLFNLNINISLIIAGFILYWIYFRTQNIIYCIIFHMTANLANTLMFNLDETKEHISILYDSTLALIISILIFILMLLSIYKVSQRRD